MATINDLKAKKDAAKGWLWDHKEHDNVLVRGAIRFLRIVYLLGKDLAEGQLSLRAMSLVYTTVISLVPLLALSFSVLKGFGAHESLRPMIEGLVAPIGADSAKIADQIIGFVDNIQIGVLGAVGLALLIYSVVSMMQKIERSFNFIWHVQRERSFGQRFTDYLSMLMVGPLLLFLSAGITSSSKLGPVSDFLLAVPGGEYLLTLIGLVIPYFIMALGFTYIYVHMPNTKVSIKAAFIGGLTTAVVWKSLGFLFTLFVAGGSSNTAIYATFASIIVLMVWFYVAWLVLLIGASVAFYAQHPFSTPYIREHRVELSSEVKERLGLDLFMRIAEAFKADAQGPTTIELVEATGMPHEVIRQLAKSLREAGLLVNTDDKPHVRYLPARALENVTVHEVLAALRNEGQITQIHLPPHKATDKLLAEMDATLGKTIGKTTIGALL